VLSRKQIIAQLLELKNFRFVAYITAIDSSTHLIRLQIPELSKKGISSQIAIQDWIVREEAGYLSAITKDGSLHISKLT
jgi:hypothetical protein